MIKERIMNKSRQKKTSSRVLLSILLAIILVFTMSSAAFASDEQAVTVEYEVSKKPIPSTTFDLYKVGKLNGTKLVLDSPYDKSNVNVDLWKKDARASEWAEAAATLYEYIKAKGIGEDSVQHPKTNAEGIMSFSGENGCVYLLGTEEETRIGDTIYQAQPMLIWVIDGKVDGVRIKPTKKTVGADKYKVIKHWKKDDADKRPAGIEVKIYEDNKFVKKVELNRDNEWCYKWTDKDKKGDWSCVETVPDNYKYTVKKVTKNNTTTIYLTNTGEKIPPDKKTPVKTGDPTSLRWVILAMALSGFALVVLAIRRRREE